MIGNYSLSTALLLVMAGTAGGTTAAFGRLLGVDDVERDELHPAVNAVDLALESRTGEGVRLSTANSLFVQDGLELRDEFLDTAVGHYGAPVRALDFRRRGDEAAAAVNEWVADETEGFIDRITDGFAEETVVVLANTMYLKASWEAVFERVDTPGTFTLADGTAVETEYMRHDGSLPLVWGADFVAVELPYEGEELGLVIVQPTDLAAFEKKMSAGRLREIAKSLGIRNISLTVPTWSTKTSLDALEPLHRLGLPRTYDFGTMVDPAALARFGGGRLEIDEILHVARIEVDEEGTTAAAATSIGITVTSVPEFVAIDGPFFGPARIRGIEGCWHRLGLLCHEDAAGFEVGGVGEAVGAASQDLEQVVGAYLEGWTLWWFGAWVSCGRHVADGAGMRLWRRWPRCWARCSWSWWLSALSLVISSRAGSLEALSQRFG